jgi:pimeloyl-ACP methyl ester carboxylesterase
MKTKAEPSRLRRALRLLVRATLGLLGLALLTGAIYQWLSVRRDNASYPAPGKLIEVDGADVHLLCMGEGSPTVVLESGMGSFSVEFIPLMREVATFTRVCAYDRAGFGWSDPLSSQTAEQVADHLHATLVAAGEAPPYVLAGHSLGGVYVRAFTGRYRDEVTGMLLIDASGDDQSLRFPAEFTRESFPWQLWACRLGNPFGIYRALQIPEKMVAGLELPAEVEPMIVARLHTNQFCASMLQLDFVALTSRHVDYDFGDLPLIVLVHGMEMPEAEQTWQEIQLEHARMSTRGELIVARESGHHIHFDQPELVVESLRRLAAPKTD